MKKILIVIVLVALLVPAGALAQKEVGGSGRFTLVPCGSENLDKKRCEFTDIITLIVRVINLLLAASAVVAMWYIFLSAWEMTISLGNPEKIMAAKTGFEKALVGFSIVLLSFAFINLLVIGIFGLEECEGWWKKPQILWSSRNCFLP